MTRRAVFFHLALLSVALFGHELACFGPPSWNEGPQTAGSVVADTSLPLAAFWRGDSAGSWLEADRSTQASRDSLAGFFAEVETSLSARRLKIARLAGLPPSTASLVSQHTLLQI